MLSPYPITAIISVILVIFQEAGGLVKKLLNTGVGLQGSTWCLAFLFSGRVSNISCRHRVLAELLEQGTRSTLEIPVHIPAPSNSNFSQSQQNLRAASGVEYDSLRSLGINPSHALQHPGFYYYMAARCTEMRRSRFLAAVESEVNLDSSLYLETTN